MSTSLPEEDLSCPVCCDIYQDPVLLSCSHSFCRTCLQRFWNSASSRICPVCRRTASKKSPPSNLALKNLCEAVLQRRGQGLSNSVCGQHGERLKFFCVEDQQPICMVCQASRGHKGHQCSPIEEAALDCKEKLNTALKTMKDKLDTITKLKTTSAMMLEHIKHQAQLTEKEIKNQFLELHQFLHKEEEVRLTALKEDEEKKALALKERDEDLLSRISTLLAIIRSTEQQMTDDDLTFLQNFKSTIKRTQSSLQIPEGLCGSLIEEAKHLNNLKFRVWKKMQEIAPYYPVTLDPNTVHPCLKISEDLTSIHYSPHYCSHPNNPERFQVSAEVLGSVALGPGVHMWEVDVGENEDWILGVAYMSITRNKEVLARPENGFWTMCFRDGEYRAMTSPPTPLAVKESIQSVRVHLDWDAGEVSFFSPKDSHTLHMFTHTFTKKVFPYFYTQNNHPLRIVRKPVTVLVTENWPLQT